ncbi:MAG: VWA domain-containing protein [Rhodothermales bacterium]
MLRISFNTLLLTVGALFLSYSTLQYIDHRRTNDDDQRITLRTSMSHPSLLGGTTQRTYIKVDLTGFKLDKETQKTPVNVALVLDKSGSMNGEKMMQAKAAAMEAVDRLGDGDIVTIITYDNTAQVLLPATEVSDKRIIRQKLQNLEAGGGTALYAGVVEGANQLREYLSENRVNRVILLSDGQANQGPETPEELGALGNSLIKDGISVSTIGLGLGYNEDLMVQLAMRSDGNHHFVEHPDLLAGMFNQEFGDVLSVVAQDVKVTIELEDGIRPISVMGRNAQIDGQIVEVSLNQVYSEQEKYIMLEVETSSEERSGEVEIAQVDLSYSNMLTQTTDHLRNAISANFTNSHAEVDENIDAETMVSAIEQQAVVMEEKAIELRDQGLESEAQEMLQQNAAFLDDNASKFDSDKLAKDAERSRGAASNLSGQDWNAQRKALRSDHYKAKTQQKN